MSGKEVYDGMSCQTFRSIVQEYVRREIRHDGDLSGLPQDLRDHARTCSSCARHLAVAEALFDVDPTTIEPPPGLADRIAGRVLDAENARDWRVPRRSVALRVTAGLAAAAVLILATVFVTLSVTQGQRTPVASPGVNQEPMELETVVVRLEFHAAGARSVAVVGDWNDWNPEYHLMKYSADTGVWQIEFTVTPNREYRYQFLVDGEQWHADPTASIVVNDGFGGVNSILDI